VAIAYRVKERLRDFYRTFDVDEANAMLEELKEHCLRDARCRPRSRNWPHHQNLV
jgi:transposase